jgi:hypothetical protein
MRINTDHSIRLGEQLYDRFGSWEKLRQASRYEDGVYIVPPQREADGEQERDAPDAS